MLSSKRSLLLISFILMFLSVRAQTYSTQQIELAEQLNSLAKNAPPELAYIQTSKDIYETGEDLWFKVYLLNSQTLGSSDLSKTLYLQLINEKTRITIWQEKYEIQNGFSNGRVLLKEDIDEGNYLLEAFTANSFFADSSEFKAIRKLKVVKDITHLRQIKAEFEKQSYGSTDSIKIKIIPISQKDTSKMDITVNLKLSGEVQNLLRTTMKLNEGKILSFKPQSFTKGSSLVIDSKYIDHFEELVLPIPGRANPIQFNVFPEGGPLVSGIKSRIAFKAVNIDGKPVDVIGTLYKNDSVELKFKSTHDGMGSFDLTPDINTNYYIRLKEPFADSIYSFPEIEPEGISIRLLSRDKDFLNFLVSKNYGQSENIYLLAQIRGLIYGLTEAKLNRELKMKVPLTGLPQGIVEVTLFNAKMVPVAERLIYANSEKKINIQTILTDSIFFTRGKVKLKIIVRDENNNPIRANLGLSVFDKLYENQSDAINIFTQMYLSTQLKGRIYNPGYYFNEKNYNRESALDNLLLTQGWRMYIWNNTNLEQFSDSNPQIISDVIKGKTYLAFGRNKLPKDRVLIMAFLPEIDSLNTILQSDPEGGFIIDCNVLKKYKNGYVYLKPFGYKGTRLKLVIDDPFKIIDQKLSLKTLSYPLLSSNTFNIENINVPLFKPGLVIIKEVSIIGQKSNLKRNKFLSSLDSLSKLDINTEPQTMDWVCKNNMWDCPNHSRDDPGSIKPIEGKVYHDINGVPHVAIYPNANKDLSEKELLMKSNIYRVKSYSYNKEFYQPNYDKEYEYLSIPDFRNTLLWNPSVLTNEKGEATLSIFSSDIYTDFVGRIEGVDGNGLLGTGYFKFTVRKLKLNP